MIKLENRYDFSVEELTEILENTPIKVDLDTNASVAEYIIQALNANAIIKRALGMETSVYHKATNGEPTVYPKDAPYHILINRNRDGKRMFECDARTIAFYACDPVQGRPHKGIVSEKKPMPTDIANISELLGNVNGWGTFQ
jgi:hypothetical protein